jgi:hypothetical protein
MSSSTANNIVSAAISTTAVDKAFKDQVCLSVETLMTGLDQHLKSEDVTSETRRMIKQYLTSHLEDMQTKKSTKRVPKKTYYNMVYMKQGHANFKEQEKNLGTGEKTPVYERTRIIKANYEAFASTKEGQNTINEWNTENMTPEELETVNKESTKKPKAKAKAKTDNKKDKKAKAKANAKPVDSDDSDSEANAPVVPSKSKNTSDSDDNTHVGKSRRPLESDSD